MYGQVGSGRTVWMEVETKTSMVLCLMLRWGEIDRSGLGLGGASYGNFAICLLPKPSLFSCTPQHSCMIGKILSTKWIVLVTDFSHFLLLILSFLLLLEGDPPAMTIPDQHSECYVPELIKFQSIKNWLGILCSLSNGFKM